MADRQFSRTRNVAPTAAKIWTCHDKDFGFGIWLLVQYKIGILRATIMFISQIPEKSRAKPGSLDGFEKLLGYYCVSVYI